MDITVASGGGGKPPRFLYSSVAVALSGKYVYVTAQNNYLYGFSIESNGSLAPVAGSPFLTRNDPVTLAIDPTGKYLYTDDGAGGNFVDAFSINEINGALTPVPGSPFAQTSSACSHGADDMAVDGSGKFLLLSQNCNGTEVFRIDPSSVQWIYSSAPWLPLPGLCAPR